MAGAGFGDLDPDDDDMEDGALLAQLGWSPSSFADIVEMPARTLWMYVSYWNGLMDKAKREGVKG